MVTGILSGCQPRQAVLTFKTYPPKPPRTQLKEAQLEINGETMTVPYDTARGAVFTIEDPKPGYAFVSMGGIKKMIFLEAGSNLTVEYLRPGEAKSRYRFSGEGSAENEFLENHERSNIMLRQNMTDKEILQLIQDSIANIHQVLENTSLSANFKNIERERLRYQGLNRIFNYKQWTPELVPFLEKQMQEKPELLKSEDYRNFMLNAVYFVAWHQSEGHDYLATITSQINYIDTCFQNNTLVDFLMGTMLSDYMKWHGADGITPLMDIFMRRASSSEVRENVKKEYEDWSRILQGKSIPEFTFLDTKGNEVPLSRFKGKYVYIDCWATWCGPCRGQIPHLKKLEEQYAGKGIEFVSISSDSDSKKWKETVKKENLKGVQLIEKCPTNSDFSDYFIITGIPRFILLDKEGRVYNANAPRPSDPAIISLFDKLPQ